MSELSYGQASARLEEILGRIEDGRVDVDELSSLEAMLKQRPEQLMLTIARRGRAYYALVE